MSIPSKLYFNNSLGKPSKTYLYECESYQDLKDKYRLSKIVASPIDGNVYLLVWN